MNIFCTQMLNETLRLGSGSALPTHPRTDRL